MSARTEKWIYTGIWIAGLLGAAYFKETNSDLSLALSQVSGVCFGKAHMRRPGDKKAHHTDKQATVTP